MLVFAVLLGTAIGAVILRAACSIFNKFAEPQNHVPEPSFGYAMLIAFVTTVVNSIVGFGVGLVIGVGLANSGMTEQQVALVAQVISLPFSILVMAVMNMLMLPTTFARGLLVALLYLAVAIAVAIVIGLVVFAVIAIFAAM
ncbi:MAG: hypothetical protein DWQ29_02285 [Planctomycetota bacterium]|nr:MAG: hypothetical protein DWQ29_02285 [Planctomycetota bacterium]